MCGQPFSYREVLAKCLFEHWLEFGIGFALCAAIAWGVTALAAVLVKKQAARQQAEYLGLERENYMGKDGATLLRAARQPILASQLLRPLHATDGGTDDYLLRAAGATIQREERLLQ